MSARDLTAWPAPHDPEHLFTKALLIYGPLPEKGWRMTRDCEGKVFSVYPRTRITRVFANEVTGMFVEEVKKRYALRKWTPYHKQRVGQSWKNLFLKWVWEKIDEA